MSRNLLHISKLDDFKTWLASLGIEHRPGRGDYDVLQVMTKRDGWQCVFRRNHMLEHFTVARPLEQHVVRYIAARKREKS